MTLLFVINCFNFLSLLHPTNTLSFSWSLLNCDTKNNNHLIQGSTEQLFMSSVWINGSLLKASAIKLSGTRYLWSIDSPTVSSVGRMPQHLKAVFVALPCFWGKSQTPEGGQSAACLFVYSGRQAHRPERREEGFFLILWPHICIRHSKAGRGRGWVAGEQCARQAQNNTFKWLQWELPKRWHFCWHSYSNKQC